MHNSYNYFSQELVHISEFQNIERYRGRPMYDQRSRRQSDDLHISYVKMTWKISLT
jgi:hypothetical protein